MRPLRRTLVTYRDVGHLANEVVYATRLPFGPGSPAWGAASYVEGCWSPVLDSVTGNVHVKVTRTHTREMQRQTVEDLSLSGGASSGVGTFQAEHHLLVGRWLICLQKQRRRPIGSPFTCGGVYARSSEHTSRKGRIRRRTGAPDRSYAGTT